MVVVGAGAAGLVGGATLAPTTDVVVLEAATKPGGRVESVRHGDYWLNIGAQFTEGAGPLFDVIDKYKIKLGSLADTRAGLYLKGRLVAADDPMGILVRSRMSLAAKVELASVGLRLRRIFKRLMNENLDEAAKYQAFLDTHSGSWLMRGVKTDEMRAMFNAWAGQWIGCKPEETAASQLAISIGFALEKAANIPNFALPVGGNQTFTDALAHELGDRLRLGAEVQSITWTEDRATVRYVDGQGPVTLAARRVIVAVPADRALAIMPDLPDEYREALRVTNYGRYILAGIFTKEHGPQRWDDYYAISTPDLPSFQAIFNHAASLRRSGPRKPGGALVCLAGGPRADELDKLSDEQIETAFLRDLFRILPELEGKIDRVVVKRQPRVVSYWAPGTRSAQEILRKPLGPIQFAGDHLADLPSLAGAVESGQGDAENILQALV
ncbi:flavin monoamine oxidase family protein [Mycobacterium branderi]|uniref:flavin monoamine oxidase family protein n=1 Tax=Mycobacterium branderi TaxID=43348 RepID=UPI001E28DACA|nr:NAD(P)/FAD-dependent oxidoreductase [Mycobacterium branderi]